MADAMAVITEKLRSIGSVAVLAGGASAEREISLRSGAAVLAALQSLGVNAQLVDPAEVPVTALQQFDVCFIALHGRGGEDGVIQGVLEHIGIPYTGSSVMASAIGMDKIATKMIWKSAGLPTPAFYVSTKNVSAQNVSGQNDSDIGFPVMIKPAHEGSSIGMRKVDAADALAEAIAEATRYDSQVLVERWIEGGEFTVAILGDEALPPIRLETPNTFYDFDAKYQANSTQYLCPCGLSPTDEQRLKSLALQAFYAIGCRGWGRVDVMQSRDGDFYLLEVNTVPGMTDHSLVPMAAAASGRSFEQLVAEILLQATERTA